jgi:hypothetical protein
MNMLQKRLMEAFGEKSIEGKQVKKISDMTDEEIIKEGERIRSEMLIKYNPNKNIPQRRGEFQRLCDVYEMMTPGQILLSEERHDKFYRERRGEYIELIDRASKDMRCSPDNRYAKAA